MTENAFRALVQLGSIIVFLITGHYYSSTLYIPSLQHPHPSSLVGFDTLSTLQLRIYHYPISSTQFPLPPAHTRATRLHS